MNNDLDNLYSIPVNNECYIYLNGKVRYYVNKIYNPEKHMLQSWGAFGMILNTTASIVKYLESIFPNNVMFILVHGDYHNDIDEKFFKIYPRVIQLNRYINIEYSLKNTIIIPADDLLFDDYLSYYDNSKYIEIEERIPKIYWRGSNTGRMRSVIVEKYLDNPNCDIKLIRKQFSGDDLQDKKPWLFSEQVDQYEPYKYSIWLSIEGWGVASDTSRALLSGCCVVYYRETKPWFHKYLVHGENCCIAENMNELHFHLTNLIGNSAQVKKIGDNGKKLAQVIFNKDFVKEYLNNEVAEKVALLT